jgi:hypothetical protein
MPREAAYDITIGPSVPQFHGFAAALKGALLGATKPTILAVIYLVHLHLTATGHL